MSRTGSKLLVALLFAILLAGCAPTGEVQPEVVAEIPEPVVESLPIQEEPMQDTQEPAPEPPPAPIFYDEIIMRIHDDLPELAFRAYSWDEEEHSLGRVSYLRVIDTESDEVIFDFDWRSIDILETWYSLSDQNDVIEPNTMSSFPAPNNESILFSNIHFADINFDGYLDLYIVFWSHWNEMAHYFVWDSVSHSFISDPYGFSTLGQVTFDFEARTARTHLFQSSSVRMHTQNITHEFVNNQWVIAQISRGRRLYDEFWNNREAIEQIAPESVDATDAWIIRTILLNTYTEEFFVSAEQLRLERDFNGIPQSVVEFDYDSQEGRAIMEIMGVESWRP